MKVSSRDALDRFFCKTQSKAVKQAEFAVANRDEAFDLVQDAMIRLARRYPDNEADWPKLFQRILQNLILDWHRRQKVRRILVWWDQRKEADDSEVGFDYFSAEEASPQEQLLNEQEKQALMALIKALPLRQQQAFLLRAWWEYSTEETAFAMGCSAGSVKTHYSRAIQKLKLKLGHQEVES